MAHIHLTASSQTFACESCGHLNIVLAQQIVSSKAVDKSQNAVDEQAHSEQEILEQVDLPPTLDSQRTPERSVSRLADATDDLNALAAANSAKDGKHEQHLEELQLHQAHVHSPHQLAQRRTSHLYPSGSTTRRSSILSRSSSQDLAAQEDEQHLPQQSGVPQPHPPITHPNYFSDPLQHPGTGSGHSQAQRSLAGSRNNSGATSLNEAGTVVFTLKGPTEVILAQIQRSTASLGSSGSSHARNPSGSPMSRSGALLMHMHKFIHASIGGCLCLRVPMLFMGSMHCLQNTHQDLPSRVTFHTSSTPASYFGAFAILANSAYLWHSSHGAGMVPQKNDNALVSIAS